MRAALGLLLLALWGCGGDGLDVPERRKGVGCLLEWCALGTACHKTAFDETPGQKAPAQLGASCAPWGTYPEEVQCDGPEDCGDGVCCVGRLGNEGPGTTDSIHASACATPGACVVRVCAVDKDCPAGQRCSNTHDYGWCE